MSAGYFEAWVNQMAYNPTPRDRALTQSIETCVRDVVGTAQVQHVGSTDKHTAVKGSDLDLFVTTAQEINRKQRVQIASQIENQTHYQTKILSHAIRVHSSPSIDISFNNTTFGGRERPIADPFHHQSHRQQAARALKFWTRRPGLPNMRGWVAEAIVLHLDQQATPQKGWDLFLKILRWFENGGPARADSMESILRPCCQSEWKGHWSSNLPGYTEALGNDARRLLQRIERQPICSIEDMVSCVCGSRSSENFGIDVSPRGPILQSSKQQGPHPVRLPPPPQVQATVPFKKKRKKPMTDNTSPQPTTPSPSPNDQRSNVKNPNNSAHTADQNNRANQLNPNHQPSKGSTQSPATKGSRK